MWVTVDCGVLGQLDNSALLRVVTPSLKVLHIDLLAYNNRTLEMIQVRVDSD